MAYGLKYQSDFYNTPPFMTLVSVKIYERDYAGGMTPIVTTRVEIQANYQDDNTPIIGSGALVVIRMDTSSMSYLEDMLTSYERQFMATIEYSGVIVFRGYSICDLNERQFLPYGEVTMQFTDYMHRMAEYYPDRLRNIGGYANVYSLVQELLTLTGFDLPLYVNSSLFEESMANGTADTCLTQMAVQNSQFYSDMFNYDSIYDAVNKCLQPMNAFLYYYNEKWVIERQEDITGVGHWVMYSGGDATGGASLKRIYNKQAGDWKYKECSQVIEYDSGLKKLILELKDKQLDSIVFNNYTEDMLRLPTHTFPEPGEMLPNTWYADEELTELKTGTNYLDLETWVHFTTSPANDDPWYGDGNGIYYNFGVYFPQELLLHEELGIKSPFYLNIGFKATTDVDITAFNTIQPRFLLRLDGGNYSGWWVRVVQRYVTGVGQDLGGPWIMLCAPESEPNSGYEALNPALYFSQYGGPYANSETVWNMQRTYDLNTCGVIVYYRETLMNFHSDEGLWEILGEPTNQRFNLHILPSWFKINVQHQFHSNYIGDIVVTTTVQDVMNKIEYYINEDFYRTDTVELFLFDLPDPNYSNGLMIDSGFSLDSSGAGIPLTQFTTQWTSRGGADPCPLYEIYAKSKFRKYGRTTHRLKGKIMTNNILKVFAILTDNNMESTSPDGGDPGGGGGVTDWYLPSMTELGYMRTNLYLNGIGGFAVGYGHMYWSSDESTETQAWTHRMDVDYHEAAPKTISRYVRAIRSFSGGSYSLGDVGPGGGWICYVSGSDYLEAAVSDQSSAANWDTANSLCSELGSAGIGDMFFLLNGYTWDLVNGTYDIDAEEYSGEDVTVEGVVYDSEGAPPEGVPDKVMGLHAIEMPIIHTIHVTWAPVGGDVIGYKLQRSPFYHILTSQWDEYWWQYYVGSNTSYVDAIYHTGPRPVPYDIKYRVCAYNTTGDGPWSDEFTMP